MAAPSRQVLDVQNILRDQRLYAGEPSGLMDKETVASIRRFQMQHDLRVTGELDGKTLEEMHLQAPENSGTAKTLEDADKQFLASLEGHYPPPVGELTSPLRGKTKWLNRNNSSSDAATDAISSGAVANVLQGYLEAASDGDAGKELSYFTQQIDYFDRGKVDRNSIKNDLRRTRTLWPHRKLQLEGVSVLSSRGPGKVDARFTVRYKAANGRKKASGVAMREVTIEAEPDGSLKIAGLRNPSS